MDYNKLTINNINNNEKNLPNSFEAPKTSPVAISKFFFPIKLNNAPPNIPPITPNIPMVPPNKYPIIDVMISVAINLGIVIDSIKNFPVPSVPDFEDKAQVNNPTFADISHINIAPKNPVRSNESKRDMVIMATIKNNAIPPVPIIESLITFIFFSGLP